jgi:DNA-binding transcriptional ArsR family regulator
MKALSDENRLAILLAVAEGPRAVVELSEATGLGQTLVSHHLKTLRETGLVSVRPQGRSNVYSICCDAISEPIELLARLATPAAATHPQESLT